LLATAANALGHAVKRRVLSVDWIVRISHQVRLRGHLIGLRLAVADRCVAREQLLPRIRRSMCGWVSRTSRLRNRHGSVDQGQQRYRRDQLSHIGSPKLGPPHDYGNGKLDHKVRHASRFVQDPPARGRYRQKTLVSASAYGLGIIRTRRGEVARESYVPKDEVFLRRTPFFQSFLPRLLRSDAVGQHI